MAKLFVFGIGGTGARVLKALTYLLASGVRPAEGITEIVPILLDPDIANGDLSQTIDLLRSYQSIRRELSFDQNGFFRTQITPLHALATDGQAGEQVFSGFGMAIPGVQGRAFKEFIGYAHLNDASKAMTEMLFSDRNLDADMQVGFKGHPNMGSIVLNQFNTSLEFKTFASNFTPEDRIFIIGSIFGGTGASGYPLLVKNIRGAADTLPSHQFLRNAFIGSLTVKPYFGVEKDEKSSIDKSSFVVKTQAALKYYHRSLNKSINAMYYVGSDLHKDYKNAEGAASQRNDAHFVELASALAVIDFSFQPIVPGSRNYKEFGVKEMSETLNFTHLAPITRSMVEGNLSRYMLFARFQRSELATNLADAWAKAAGMDTNFLMQPFYQAVDAFDAGFIRWTEEMARNRVGFRPFRETDSNSVFALVEGRNPKSSLFGSKNYELYREKLSTIAAKKMKGATAAQRMMELFYLTTHELLEEKVSLV